MRLPAEYQTRGVTRTRRGGRSGSPERKFNGFAYPLKEFALPESRYGSPLERDLQKALECELKRLVLSCTHRVSPSVAGFLASEPRNARRADVSWTYGLTAKSAILA